jgi:hypothetical protein
MLNTGERSRKCVTGVITQGAASQSFIPESICRSMLHHFCFWKSCSQICVLPKRLVIRQARSLTTGDLQAVVYFCQEMQHLCLARSVLLIYPRGYIRFLFLDVWRERILSCRGVPNLSLRTHVCSSSSKVGKPISERTTWEEMNKILTETL